MEIIKSENMCNSTSSGVVTNIVVSSTMAKNKNLMIQVPSGGLSQSGQSNNTTTYVLTRGNNSVISNSEQLLSVVKTEPSLHSPVNNMGHHHQELLIQPANANGLFSGIASSNKRPRPDDWLTTTSPGSVVIQSTGSGSSIVTASGAPLTPSPGPPSVGGNNAHAFTVISNGYSSPMSSGSYDPYSPNGKIGKN